MVILMLVKQNKHISPENLLKAPVDGQVVTPGKHLKVLDIYFSNDLTLDYHINNIINKLKPNLLKLKFSTYERHLTRGES